MGAYLKQSSPVGGRAWRTGGRIETRANIIWNVSEINPSGRGEVDSIAERRQTL